ncbi:helix-turn-helix domain-containing protein [Chitinophagaceae bacterium MMS25-I14]
MNQLIKVFSCPVNENEALRISVNPPYSGKVHFTLNTRLFLFEKTGGHIYIDTCPYEISAGSLYIVPPLHLHYICLPEENACICIDIPETALNSYHKKLLYAVKYKTYKQLPSTGPGDLCSFSEILQLTGAGNAHHILHVITHWIELRIRKINGIWMEKYRNKSDTHIKTADKFLSVLREQDLSLNSCTINAFAEAVSCSERTLHRSCMIVFGCCAKDIVKYHIMMKAYCMLSDNRLPVTAIARSLGFSTINAFDRYIKRLSGMTPTEFRSNPDNAAFRQAVSETGNFLV